MYSTVDSGLTITYTASVGVRAAGPSYGPHTSMNLKIRQQRSCTLQFTLRTSVMKRFKRRELGIYARSVGVELPKFCSTATRLQCRRRKSRLRRSAPPSLVPYANRPFADHRRNKRRLNPRTHESVYRITPSASVRLISKQ